MTAFIEEHRGRFGLEPICRVMQFAPSTYWAARSRPPSPRSLRDEVLKQEIVRVHAANYGVYGAHKIWKQLDREGITVARCTVARLMRELGLRGVRRGKRPITTTPGETNPPSSRLGRARLRRGSPQPALGRRPFLRAHLLRLLLSRPGDRRVFPA